MLFGLTNQCFTSGIDRRWAASIEEIQAGDYVCSENTGTGEKELRKVLSVSVTETVEGVQIEQLEEAVKVYNLEIEDSHTYYVSVDEVLVHNECDIPWSWD